MPLCPAQPHHPPPPGKLDAANTYCNAISAAKCAHWQTFLSTLTPATLFTASAYATKDPTVSTLPIRPLKRQNGELTSEPEEQAELLFQGTSARTIPCDLSNVSHYPPHPNTPTLFTMTTAVNVINRLLPDKAPGADGITNRVIRAGGGGGPACATPM